MTKKYIITKDQIDAALSDTSEFPVQNKVVKTAVDAKVNKTGYTSADEGKIAKVVAEGSDYVLKAVEAGTTSVAWSDVTSKPFSTVGSGLKVVSDELVADPSFKFEIFATLPAASETYKNTIGLIAISAEHSVTQNIYEEYVCVGTGTPVTWSWEKLGTFDFTMTQTASEIKINGNTVQTATDSQIGLMSAADHTSLTGKQDKSNLVTTFSATPVDTKYPSEKLVKDQLDLKQTTANLTTTIAAAASASNTKYPSEKAVATSLAGKQDVANLVTTISGTDDSKYPSEKAVKTALDGKIAYTTGSTSTSFTLGKDASGYFIDE